MLNKWKILHEILSSTAAAAGGYEISLHFLRYLWIYPASACGTNMRWLSRVASGCEVLGVVCPSVRSFVPCVARPLTCYIIVKSGAVTASRHIVFSCQTSRTNLSVLSPLIHVTMKTKDRIRLMSKMFWGNSGVNCDLCHGRVTWPSWPMRFQQ